MSRNLIKWLYPGVGVKRWVAVISLGFVSAHFSGVLLYSALTNTEVALRLRLGSAAVGLILIAGFLVITGIYRLVKNVERMVGKHLRGKGVIRRAMERRLLEHGINVVCLGGGTGMSTLLRGLKAYTANITAIVSVADDGGSSGRLRQEFDMLPPGDIRKCLIALSDDSPVMSRLLEHRFSDAELAGHSMGNLVLTTLTQITGDFGEAIREANTLFAVRGRVLPATLDRIFLIAHHPDGSTTIGQRHITKTEKPIERVELKPNPKTAAEDILQAIEQAQLIVFGPGSLYTSVIPTLLTAGVPQAVRESSAVKVYVCNIVSYEGETKDFTLMDHIRAMEKHGGEGLFSYVLVNEGVIPRARRAELAEANARVIIYDRSEVPEDTPYRFVTDDVVDRETPVRHDSDRLAKALMDLYHRAKPA